MCRLLTSQALTWVSVVGRRTWRGSQRQPPRTKRRKSSTRRTPLCIMGGAAPRGGARAEENAKTRKTTSPYYLGLVVVLAAGLVPLVLIRVPRPGAGVGAGAGARAGAGAGAGSRAGARGRPGGPLAVAAGGPAGAPALAPARFFVLSDETERCVQDGHGIFVRDKKRWIHRVERRTATNEQKVAPTYFVLVGPRGRMTRHTSEDRHTPQQQGATKGRRCSNRADPR